MSPCRFVLQLTALLVAVSMFPVEAGALMRWDESRNQIFVNASGTMTYDSNIYTASGGGGDIIYNGTLGLEYERRAGLISVSGTAVWNLARFSDNRDESFQNPALRTEFTKDSGRTTGALTLAAQRESRADPAANLRTDSWNYDGGLNFNYPIIERYSISGGFNYGLRDYGDNTLLVDLATYSASADLFYVLTTQRDLLAGYRVRMSDTSADSRFQDHAFTLGVSGRILPKLNGTLRVGYQSRLGEGPGADDNSGITTSGSATWSLNKRASLTLQVSKDFSTTSTNITIDSLAGTLDAQYVFNSRLSGGGGFGGGTNRFLGSLGDDREDIFLQSHLNASYTFSERLRLSAAYTYYQSWSTLAVSDFDRHSVSLSVSSRF